MQPSISTILSLTDIFDNLTETQLQLVAAICDPFTYQKGQLLFREHENSTDMYVIGRGGVEIMMNPGVVGTHEESLTVDPVVIAEIRQGQVLGEVALVDQGIRSATARASRDDTVVLRLSRERLMRLCDMYPELGYKLMRNLAADLALKIRQTDLTLRQYQLMLSGR